MYTLLPSTPAELQRASTCHSCRSTARGRRWLACRTLDIICIIIISIILVIIITVIIK